MKNINRLASEIVEASVMRDLTRILNLRLDDKVVISGIKLLSILNRIKMKSKDIIVDIDIESIEKKLRGVLNDFPKVIDDIFILNEKLVLEEELKNKKK